MRFPAHAVDHARTAHRAVAPKSSFVLGTRQKYWEHSIEDEDDFENYLDYIHFNPVKHGYATHPAGWPWQDGDWATKVAKRRAI